MRLSWHSDRMDKLLLSFWALCLLIGVSYLIYANVAPPNPHAGYRTDVPIGWDLRLACGASRAYGEGRDPYLLDNLRGTDMGLTYIYPPVFLDVFAPACRGSHPLDHMFVPIYVIAAISIVALLAGGGGRPSWRELVIMPTMVFSGFSGFYWVLATGNVVLFISLLLATAMFCFRRGVAQASGGNGLRRIEFAGAIFLGLALSLKFIYAPLLFALVLLPKPWTAKAWLAVTTAGAYLVPLILSVVLYPDVFASFVKSILGQIPNQLSPLHEGCDPSLFCFMREMVGRKLSVASTEGLGLLNLSAGIAVLALFWGALMRTLGIRGNFNRETLGQFNPALIADPVRAYRLTFFLMFTIFILMNRVKDYGYFELAIFVAPILVTLPTLPSMIAGFGAILLPLITNEPRLAWHSYFFNYDQVIEAGIAYLAIIGALWFEPKAEADNAPQSETSRHPLRTVS